MADNSKYNGSTWGTGFTGIRKTATETLSLPQTIYADGTAATVSLKGNTVQNGTPTPSNPIQPQETGERTGNLFDVNGAYSLKSDSIIITNNGITATLSGSATDRIYYTQTYSAGTYKISFDTQRCEPRLYSDKEFTGSAYNSYYNGYYRAIMGTQTITFAEDFTIGFILAGAGGNNAVISNIMFQLSTSTADYEPYGYKIPISSGQQTTNIYLRNVQTVRQIYKYVFTGEENWTNNFGASLFMVQGLLNSAPFIPQVDSLSTHYTYKPIQSGLDAGLSHGQYALQRSGTQQQYSYNIAFKNTDYTDTTDFKAYLQEQYAAGTPVTVWYVLATPETAVVNEPLRKIGDYADTVSGITIPTITGKDSFDVLTTLKPSEVSLAYTGWHDASVKAWDGDSWE